VTKEKCKNRNHFIIVPNHYLFQKIQCMQVSYMYGSVPSFPSIYLL
jgi:hypothetical protein